jgi:hypothetical protein
MAFSRLCNENIRTIHSIIMLSCSTGLKEFKRQQMENCACYNFFHLTKMEKLLRVTEQFRVAEC